MSEQIKQAEAKEAFCQWCVLELLGHVRMAGRVTEVDMFGEKIGQIDIPRPEGGFATRFFTAKSIYLLTPVSEAVARSVAAGCQPQLVHQWELPAPRIATSNNGVPMTDEDFGDSAADDDDQSPPF